ncbi:MAG: DUF1080 domain-containing protein [Bacteroidales bacterium]|nr:DUF1080 domain-containing protein [Bacteroidales bacterium]
MKRKITMPVLLRVLSIAVFGVMLSCTGRVKSTAEQTEEIRQANEAEQADEWISLFDGETLDGWKRYNADEIGPLWTVEEGAIKCDGRGHGEGSPESGGSLITLQTFGNFELELEWKISEGGNSGILYHVVEKPEYSHAYVTGPEYQVMDDPAGAVSEEMLNKRAGSNYDMYAAPSFKKLNPVGEWNTAGIVYKDGKVEHWLNGEKVVEFDENSEDYKEKFNKSKWSSGDYPFWNTYKEGSIGLQDHGAAVWYRNIRIREL